MELFGFIVSAIISVGWLWVADKAYTKKRDKFDTIFYAALGGFWANTAITAAIRCFIE